MESLESLQTQRPFKSPIKLRSCLQKEGTRWGTRQEQKSGQSQGVSKTILMSSVFILKARRCLHKAFHPGSDLAGFVLEKITQAVVWKANWTAAKQVISSVFETKHRNLHVSPWNLISPFATHQLVLPAETFLNSDIPPPPPPAKGICLATSGVSSHSGLNVTEHHFCLIQDAFWKGLRHWFRTFPVRSGLQIPKI